MSEVWMRMRMKLPHVDTYNFITRSLSQLLASTVTSHGCCKRTRATRLTTTVLYTKLDVQCDKLETVSRTNDACNG